MARDKSNPDHFHVSTFSHLLTSVIVRVWFLLGAGRLCFQAYLDEITRSNKLFLVVYSRKDRSPNYKKRLEKKKEKKEGEQNVCNSFLSFLPFDVRVARSLLFVTVSSFRSTGRLVLSSQVKDVTSEKEAARGKGQHHFSLASFKHVGSLI